MYWCKNPGFNPGFSYSWWVRPAINMVVNWKVLQSTDGWRPIFHGVETAKPEKKHVRDNRSERCRPDCLEARCLCFQGPARSIHREGGLGLSFLKPWTTEVATQRRSLLQPGRFIAAQSRQDSSFTVRDLAPTPQWSENPQETRVFTRPGKRLHSELERSTMLSMGSIPLFRLGHVQYKLPEGTPKA